METFWAFPESTWSNWVSFCVPRCNFSNNIMFWKLSVTLNDLPLTFYFEIFIVSQEAVNIMPKESVPCIHPVPPWWHSLKMQYNIKDKNWHCCITMSKNKSLIRISLLFLTCISLCLCAHKSKVGLSHVRFCVISSRIQMHHHQRRPLV